MNVKDEKMSFFELDGIPYNVEIVITEADKIYVTAIRKLEHKLVTEEDFEKWQNTFTMEYNDQWYAPMRISSWLKFTVSNKKQSINWSCDGVKFEGTDEKEKVKSIIEDIVRNTKIERDYDGFKFAQ